MIGDLVGEKKKVKNLSRVVGGLILILLLALASIFAVALLAGEAIKESHVTGGTMTSKKGGAVQVDGVKAATTIWDLPAVATNNLAKMKEVTFFVDLTNKQNAGGWAEASYKVAGVFKVSSSYATLVTTSGEELTINRATQTGVLYTGGNSYPISDRCVGACASATSGRRLRTGMVREVVPVHVNKIKKMHARRRERRRLQAPPGMMGEPLMDTMSIFDMMPPSTDPSCMANSPDDEEYCEGKFDMAEMRFIPAGWTEITCPTPQCHWNDGSNDDDDDDDNFSPPPYEPPLDNFVDPGSGMVPPTMDSTGSMSSAMSSPSPTPDPAYVPPVMQSNGQMAKPPSFVAGLGQPMPMQMPTPGMGVVPKPLPTTFNPYSAKGGGSAPPVGR